MSRDIPTNLGPVPAGMTFRDATRSVIGRRKYIINPEHESGRLTLCETLREIWRLSEGMPANEKTEVQMLVGAAFDYAKRMDAKLKSYASVPAPGQ